MLANTKGGARLADHVVRPCDQDTSLPRFPDARSDRGAENGFKPHPFGRSLEPQCRQGSGIPRRNCNQSTRDRLQLFKHPPIVLVLHDAEDDGERCTHGLPECCTKRADTVRVMRDVEQVPATRTNPLEPASETGVFPDPHQPPGDSSSIQPGIPPAESGVSQEDVDRRNRQPGIRSLMNSREAEANIPDRESPAYHRYSTGH